MKRRIHMEGGNAENAAKRAQQRHGASELFNKVRPPKARFEVRLGTNTSRTIEAFLNDPSDGQLVLLVDSDGDVEGDEVAHLRARGNDLPDGVVGSDVHLMTHTMETWLIADPSGLRRAFPRLNASKLPTDNLEARDRTGVCRALESAIGKPYDKIVGLAALQHLDPILIAEKCPSADRFFTRLRESS